MSGPVTLERQGEVALVVVDNPPVNALSQAVRQGIEQAFAEADRDPAVKAIAIYGAGRTFIAGADIKEFGKPPLPPLLPDAINAIEKVSKPSVAVLHGTALGGGLEVALGCHYRVALPTAKMGLPEVNIGLMPGAGATQRLPRLTAMPFALDLITSGKPVGAKEALAAGLIDEISSLTDPREAALAAARDLVEKERPMRRVSELPVPPGDHPATFAKARETLKRKARGQVSPFKAIDAVEAGLSMDFYEAVLNERKLFMECMATPEREAMIHAFFAEREVGKVPEASAAEPRPLEKIGVIGGGTMGSGISVAALSGGLSVTMVERDAESALRGRSAVTKLIETGVKRGLISEAQRDVILADHFKTVDDIAALADADLIIEAVFEEMDVKRDVFRRLDRVAKPGAVLATNTSYLDVNQIADATSRPADVIGLHFFSPAHIMRLLEIVVADRTAPDVTATGFALAKKLGKIAVRAGVCDGFIGNRMLSVYRAAADAMMEDGASPYEIDAALEAFGFAMGPYAVADLAGLDIGWAARKRQAATRHPDDRDVEIADRICERGWFGRKTGRGFYRYPEGASRGEPDPEVEAIIAEERKRKGITPRSFTPEEIVRRYMAAMVNEGAKVVEEGIALRPLDVDVTLLNGYGFPRAKGGPMKWADMQGLDTILAAIREHAKEDPRFWQPAGLLVQLVERGETFDSLNKWGEGAPGQ